MVAGVTRRLRTPFLVADYCQDMTERESITYQERYFGAKTTSVVLKVFGTIWFVAGVVVIDLTYNRYRNNGASGRSLLIVIAIEVAATLLGATVFAFFAYVLDLLRAIWEEAAGEND
jgi:hypothetical protein